MITASVKTSRTKILGVICVVLAVIVALILFFGSESTGEAEESISRRVTDNEERITYLASKGFETATEPSCVEDVLLPEEMDEVLLKYNEIQQRSSFDLIPYLGKTVKKYVYPIEEKEETFATLYVYENVIIAGDIASRTEGWQRPIDGGGNMG